LRTGYDTAFRPVFGGDKNLVALHVSFLLAVDLLRTGARRPGPERARLVSRGNEGALPGGCSSRQGRRDGFFELAWRRALPGRTGKGGRDPRRHVRQVEKGLPALVKRSLSRNDNDNDKAIRHSGLAIKVRVAPLQTEAHFDHSTRPKPVNRAACQNPVNRYPSVLCQNS
jgi:hypothetical protein